MSGLSLSDAYAVGIAAGSKMALKSSGSALRTSAPTGRWKGGRVEAHATACMLLDQSDCLDPGDIELGVGVARGREAFERQRIDRSGCSVRLRGAKLLEDHRIPDDRLGISAEKVEPVSPAPLYLAEMDLAVYRRLDEHSRGQGPNAYQPIAGILGLIGDEAGDIVRQRARVVPHLVEAGDRRPDFSLPCRLNAGLWVPPIALSVTETP